MPAPVSTGISFKIDEDTDRQLAHSANINQRSKRREARVRLIDHLSRFERHHLSPPLSKKKQISIGFSMDTDTNRRLTTSSQQHQNPKHVEASIRLADHLSKFDSHMNPTR